MMVLAAPVILAIIILDGLSAAGGAKDNSYVSDAWTTACEAAGGEFQGNACVGTLGVQPPRPR